MSQRSVMPSVYSFVVVVSDGMCTSSKMRFLVTLISLLGITTCLAWDLPQQVQDTPEVAAAKAAHLGALAKAKEKAREKAKYGQDGSWRGEKKSLKDEGNNKAWKNGWKDDRAWDATVDLGNRNEDDGNNKAWENGWNGDRAWDATVDLGNQNEDDGEWKGDDSWQNYDDGSWEEDRKSTEKPEPEQRRDGHDRWTGPVALPPGYDETGAPLPVEDTPEVAAAKAKHLLLYAKAVSRSQAAPLQASSRAPNQQRQQPNNNAILTAAAKPRVRPAPGRSASAPHRPAPVWEINEDVHDTPEVAAAKSAHFAAHAKRRL